LGLSLGEGPRRNAKALKCVFSASEGILFQYALDTLSYPVISTECERVFSNVKKLITPERNHLGEDIIEACEYLKA
jgi:hypothetical protein